MKLSKRIIVESSIIFGFCMMIVPMTAIASSSKCPPHYITESKNQQNSVTTTQHEYIYGTIEKEDGTEEYFYEDCTITITIDQYERECTQCELYRAQEGAGEIRHHSK